MIVNPDKFKYIPVQKKQVLNQPSHFMIGNNKVDIGFSVKLLGNSIDDQLGLNQQISNICKFASNQLNALGRLKTFLGLKAKKGFHQYFHFIKFQLLSACLVHLVN